MIFFIFERFGRMHENKTFYFILFFIFYFVLMKIRYLITDLYLYSIKIQTNIDQNALKYLRKITDFFKRIFLKNFFWADPNPAHVTGLNPATHVAGLDLANPAWLLAQPMTQLSHARVKFFLFLPTHCLSFVFTDSKSEDPWLLTEQKRNGDLWLSFVFCFFLFFRQTCVNCCEERK